MNILFISLIAMGGLGLFFASVLAIASEKLKVKEDPRVGEILETLPGLNCGACGVAGCHALAEKIVAQGNFDNLRCPAGGSEIEEKIANILGISAGTQIKKRAVIKCGGTRELAADRAQYQGVQTCTAAEIVSGGAKACAYGCLSFGDCVKVCPFDAIYIGEDGLPHVVEEKCTACGLCVEVCPRKIIELLPCSERVFVNCSSKDKGKIVREVCKVGCIGCMICVKQAPGSYEVKEFLAKVLHEKGDAQAEPAIAKCPTKCIIKQ